MHRVCLYDPIELNKHNFIISTIIISNFQKLLFSLNKVLLFHCCLLNLHCIHFMKILLILFDWMYIFEHNFCCWCFQTDMFFYIEQIKIFFRLTSTYFFFLEKKPPFRPSYKMVSAFCDINLSIIHLKEDVLEYEH